MNKTNIQMWVVLIIAFIVFLGVPYFMLYKLNNDITTTEKNLETTTGTVNQVVNFLNQAIATNQKAQQATSTPTK